MRVVSKKGKVYKYKYDLVELDTKLAKQLKKLAKAEKTTRIVLLNKIVQEWIERNE